MAVAVFLVLGLLAERLHAAEFSLSATGTRVYLGTVTPGQPATVPYAVQLVVRSTGMPYSLQAVAPANFATTVDPFTMPIGRASWQVHGLGGFTPFVPGLQTLRDTRPPTPLAGEATVLDIRLAPAPTDPATKQDGSDPYRAAIVYSVTAGTVDTSYAAPNPFSPDGDGVNDQTELHWFQDTAALVNVNIYASDGVTLVRTLVTERAFTGMVEHFLAWDGRDDQRLLAPEGDYLYSITDAATGGGIAAGLVGLERGVPTGTATVSGLVRSSQASAPVAGATVELFRAGGSRFGVTTTDAAGSYVFASVAAGSFFLRVVAPLHFPFESPTFEVGAGPVTYDVLLVHNHSLTIKKTVDPADAEPGDLVVFTVEVSTRGGVTRVDDVVVDDDLPAGLRLLPNSVRLSTGDVGRALGVSSHERLTVSVGAMEPSSVVTLTYAATVLPGTRPGRLTNRAAAVGRAAGVRVTAGPTFASVFVHDGDTGDRSLVFGRVFIDEDRDGRFSRGDAPLVGARVVLDDGTIVVVDSQGRYSLKGVRRGARLFMAVVRAKEASASTALVPSGPSKLALRDLAYGVAAEIDFPFSPEQAAAEGDVVPAATVGVVDLTVGLALPDTGGAILRFLGRVGVFFERDLGGGYRLSGSVDTRRDPRDETAIGDYQLAFQPETGDTSFAIRPAQDRIGLRLTAPWGRAELLRTGVSLGNVELINPNRRYLGIDVTADKEKRWWRVRSFVGLADSMARVDRFPNDGTTGPFQLAAAPVQLSSERVFIETQTTGQELVTSRAVLRAGADYTLDYMTGLLVLHAPRAVDPGEQITYVVEYEYFPPNELPPTFIGGGRATASLGRTTLGASFFLEDATPDVMAAAGLDAHYADDRLSVLGEAAVATRSAAAEEGADDPTAVRVRGAFAVTPDVDVYAFANRIGNGYSQKTNYLTVAPSPINFSQLPTSQPLIPLRVLQGMFDGQQEFPFFLGGDAGTFESGLGTQYRPRNDLDLSLGSYNHSDAATDFTHYAAARYHAVGYPSVFVGATEEANGLRGSRDRAWIVGTRIAAPLWDVESGYRGHQLDGGDAAGDVSGHSGLLRLRYKRWKIFQPGVVAYASRETLNQAGCADQQPGCEIAGDLLAAGFESGYRQIGLYAYAGTSHSEDVLGPHQRKFGTLGTLWALRRLAGTVRFMAIEDDLGRELSADGRVRLFLTDAVSAFGFVAWRSGKPGESGTWNNVVGLAYRPLVRPSFYLFLKIRDRQLLGRDDATRTFQSKLGTVDLVLPAITRKRLSLQMGTRFAWKRAAIEEGDVDLTVAAEEITWRMSHRYHVIGGMRMASSTNAGGLQLGGTLAAGMLLSDAFRLTLGLNYANEQWVFEADDSIPGFFINITGFYGAAGAPAEPI